MEFSVKKEMYLKLKALSVACLKDTTTRIGLTHILYDHKKKQFIATDGHMLRIEYYDVGLDEDFLLHPKHLKLTKKAVMQIDGEWVDLEIIPRCDNSSEVGGVTFPQYEQTIPANFEGELNSITLSLDLLVRVNKSIVWPSAYQGLEFRFNGKHSAIGLFGRDEDSEKILRGIIMPVRSN